MKQLILLILVACLLCMGGLVYAENTGRGNYTVDTGDAFAPWVTDAEIEDALDNNPYLYHSHSYQKYEKKPELGIGLDFLYFVNGKANIQNKVLKTLTPDEIEFTNSFDFNESCGDGYKGYVRARYYFNSKR